MADRIKQDPDVFLGLELGEHRAHLDRAGGAGGQVRHRDVEVGLGLLLAGRARPGSLVR